MVVDQEDTPVVSLIEGNDQVVLGKDVSFDPVANGRVTLSEMVV